MEDYQKIIAYLEKFRISYKEKDNSLIINLGMQQQVIVEFYEDGSLTIKDYLQRGNNFTGYKLRSFNRSMISLSCGLFLMFALIEILKAFNPEFDFAPMAVIFTGGAVLWALYYHIRAEHFKRTITDCVLNKQ